MVSKDWGVLPRFSRVKPVRPGFESDKTSLLTFVRIPAPADDEETHQTVHIISIRISICIRVLPIETRSVTPMVRYSVRLSSYPGIRANWAYSIVVGRQSNTNARGGGVKKASDAGVQCLCARVLVGSRR